MTYCAHFILTVARLHGMPNYDGIAGIWFNAAGQSNCASPQVIFKHRRQYACVLTTLAETQICILELSLSRERQ